MAKKIEKPIEIYIPKEKKYYLLKRPAITIYPVPYEITLFEKMTLINAINDLKHYSCKQK